MGFFDRLRAFLEVEEPQIQRPLNREPMRTKETVIAVLRGPDGEIRQRIEAEQARMRPVPQLPPS